MSDTALRSGLIRLAFHNPELRPTLLPLIEKHAGDEEEMGEGDMAVVLDAEADPTSHDQNLPEHYYFGKTAEERLENIEKMLSQFASPKSKDQNKPQSYYGLPPKGKQAASAPVPLERAKKGDSVTVTYKGEKVTGKVVRVKVDGTVTVDLSGKHSDEDVGYVDFKAPKGKQASVGRTAMDFPSEEALKQYLRDHPNADRKKHRVRKDTTYEKHHAKVESAVTDKFNDVTSHLSDAGLSEDEAFGDREMSALGQKWFSVARVKLNEAKKSADREKLNAVEKELGDIAGKMKARITELGKNKKGKQASVKSASRPLGPGVHLIEDLSVLGPNFRLVFRELGGDFLGSEQVPGYYLDLGGLLKVVYKTPKMSPAGEAQAKKTIAKLLAMMKAGSTKTAGGSGAANAEYLRQSPLKNKILQAVAKHYGTTTSAIMSELTDPDAEAVFEYIGNDRALAMAVYRDMKAKGLV